MKITFLDSATLGDTSLKPIAELGELVCYPTSTAAEALERVSDCEVLIVNKIQVTDELLSRAAKLKLICEAATGVNNIDLQAAQKRGISVKNVSAYSTDSVVQATFCHILNLMGNAAYFDGRVKDGSYTASGLFTDLTRPFHELAGKTLGVIGMGAIGSKVAKVAEAFGMRVVYFSTSGTSHCQDYPSLSLEQLLSISDIVTVHAPLNERTKGLICAKELKLMKGNAFVINAGRGGIIDEKDLAEAVDAGTIAGAGLDVFSKEPLPADNPLMLVKHKERLSLSPHTAWASVEARERLVARIAENIRETSL